MNYKIFKKSQGTIKARLFKLPRKATEDLKQAWIQNIPKQKDNRVFDFSNDVLCQLHFDEQYIKSHFCVTYNGVNIKMGERKIWTLYDNAVPTIFENNKDSLNQSWSEEKQKAPARRRAPRPRKRGPTVTKKRKISDLADTSPPGSPDIECFSPSNQDQDSDAFPGEDAYNLIEQVSLRDITVPEGWIKRIAEDKSVAIFEIGSINADFIANVKKYIRVSILH